MTALKKLMSVFVTVPPGSTSPDAPPDEASPAQPPSDTPQPESALPEPPAAVPLTIAAAPTADVALQVKAPETIESNTLISDLTSELTEIHVDIIEQPARSASPTVQQFEKRTGPASVIALKNVTKTFSDPKNQDPLVAIENLNFTVEKQGEFVVLLGPSGCGKSTILSLVSGLSLPEMGEVWVLGSRVTGPDPNSATVPQSYTCFPWLTVQQNVEFGLSLQGDSAAMRRTVAAEYLAKVGLTDRAAAYPNQLSGGMQQRVAIARTLAVRRQIVLMDEPFGALDAQTREEMQQMLLSLWKEERNTVLFVTHDITEAIVLADRVVVFTSRPARIRDQFSLEGDLGRPFDRLSKDRATDPNFIKWHSHLRSCLRATNGMAAKNTQAAASGI